MIAIILVNWKNYDDTHDCLQSLDLLDHTPTKIIVVDNESQEKKAAHLLKMFPNIILLPQVINLGFTGANNIGIQHALDLDVPYIMLLNNDTVVTSDFIRPLLTTLDASDDIGAVQPKILFFDAPHKIWNAGGLIQPFITYTKTIGFRKINSSQYDGIKEVDWITGCCILLKSEVVRAVGLLDDRFFAYYEYVDWSLRIRNKGYRLLCCADAPIYHKVSASSIHETKTADGYLSPFVHFLNIRNHVFLVRLHSKGINAMLSHLYLLLKITGYVVYFSLRRRNKKLKMSLKGFIEGYKTPL